MVKRAQTNRRQIANKLFECVWSFCGVGAQRLKYGYHNFTSIVSCHQYCFWCQLKFNVVSTLISTFNQSWQYVIDSIMISRRSTSRRHYNTYINVETTQSVCCGTGSHMRELRNNNKSQIWVAPVSFPEIKLCQ